MLIHAASGGDLLKSESIGRLPAVRVYRWLLRNAKMDQLWRLQKEPSNEITL